MEKYLALVLLSAPGFIAKFVAECLGNKPPKRGEFETIMVYASYSLFSVALTLGLAWYIEIFPAVDSWVGLENNFLNPLFCLKFLLLSLFCSAIIGASWCLVVEQNIIKIFNWFSEKIGKNQIFLEGTLFHKIFDDGKDHFLLIEKSGVEIIAGFFKGASSAKSERKELYITAHKGYRDWLEYAKTDPSHVLNNVKGVYLDIDSGIVIKELEFPPEFLISSEGQELEAAVVDLSHA